MVRQMQCTNHPRRPARTGGKRCLGAQLRRGRRGLIAERRGGRAGGIMMGHILPWQRSHRASWIFSDGPARDALRPLQAGRLSRFSNCELLSCRKRAARSFSPRAGPSHLEAISRNTVCLNPCGSSFQCATTLCPKLRRMSSDAYREAVSGSAARAPPSFSQFESTLEASY